MNVLDPWILFNTWNIGDSFFCSTFWDNFAGNTVRPLNCSLTESDRLEAAVSGHKSSISAAHGYVVISYQL